MSGAESESQKRQLEQRMLLELRLAARIGATLYVPTHAFLAALDFLHAPAPWAGLAVRAASAAAVWWLVWFLNAKLKDAAKLHWVNHAVYFAALAPVFWIGGTMPETFLVAFLPTLVALAVFLPGRARDLWAANAFAAAAGIAFVAAHPADFAAAPRVYLVTAVVNMALIAAGGSYLAARRRSEVVKWVAATERLEEVLRFGEQMADAGILQAPEVAKLRRLAENRPDYSREQFLLDLEGSRALTKFQARTILERGFEALRIGAWLLVEPRGEGGVGEVFRARHLRTGQVAAIKRILPAALAQPTALARFRREAAVGGELDHPNIVKTLEVLETDGRPAIVMEFVPGGSLADRLEREPALAPEEVRRLGIEICAALEHAWERKLVHRDLKPANILLGADGRAKLGDFGLVHAAHGASMTALTQSGVVMGTLDYMAPEQAGDASGVDIRADLYSLGCTLYHAATGLVPFDADTPIRKILAHQSQPPVPLRRAAPRVPADLAAVIERLMAKDPAARFQTPAEAAAALASASAP